MITTVLFLIIIYFYIVVYVYAISANNKSNTNTQQNTTSSKSLHQNFTFTIPVRSLDEKSKVVYIKGAYTVSRHNQFPSSVINEQISKTVKLYYSKKYFSNSITEENKDELYVRDMLSDKLYDMNINLNSFSLSLKPFNANFEKIDCTHYDNTKNIIIPKIKNTYDDYINDSKSIADNDPINVSTSDNAIKNTTFDISDNPIRESYSITSILHNTLDNSESNVDPIDNKF